MTDNRLFRLIEAERKKHLELTSYKKAERHVLTHHPREYLAATAPPPSPPAPPPKPAPTERQQAFGAWEN